MNAAQTPAPSFFDLVAELFRGAGRAAWEHRRRGFLILGLTVVAILLLHPLDAPFMRWLASWRTPAVVKAAKLVSLLGEMHLLPLVVVLGFWGWAESTRRGFLRIHAGASVLAMIAGGILVQFFKYIFGRPRPHLSVPDQLDWFRLGWDSFPSGHSTHWCALVGALWISSPRLAGRLALPLALLVMAARVLVPRHYPTDIVGGAVLGLLCGLCFGLAARRANLRLGRPEHLHR